MFSLFCQNCQKFCFEQLAKNSSLIGDISAVFSKFTKFPVAIVGRGGDKRYESMSHVTWWMRYPKPKSQRLQQEQQISITKICTYYKLGQACITNWGSFVLLQIRANVVANWGSFIITNWDKCCYKLGQLLQIRETVVTK